MKVAAAVDNVTVTLAVIAKGREGGKKVEEVFTNGELATVLSNCKGMKGVDDLIRWRILVLPRRDPSNQRIFDKNVSRGGSLGASVNSHNSVLMAHV